MKFAVGKIVSLSACLFFDFFKVGVDSCAYDSFALVVFIFKNKAFADKNVFAQVIFKLFGIDIFSVLGYNKQQTFFKIIFPQMVKRVLPPVTNEVITLVKDTSLAFVLTYEEMFTVAKQIAAAQTTIMPLFVAGVFYFIFNAVVAFAMERIEKKLSYYR